MNRAAKVSVVIAILSLAVSLIASATGNAQRRQRAGAKKEYFTEDELDLIRDAQELGERVPVYIKLAQKRLIFLGLMEKSEKEKEKEVKAQQKRQKAKTKPEDTRATANKVDPDDTSYLADFTPAELLHGYMEALDEIMTNIDYAYSRKLDVRNSVEDLEKFSRETIPVLQKFMPKNDSERVVMEEAIDKAKETQEQAKDALKTVPKTEKKRKE
jgi:hypothetical protein